MIKQCNYRADVLNAAFCASLRASVIHVIVTMVSPMLKVCSLYTFSVTICHSYLFVN